MTREDIVTYARTYLGVPFVHQGRNRAGIDCGGLLVGVREGFGLPVKDLASYPRRIRDVDTFLDLVEQGTRKVHDGTGGFMKLVEGQILVFMIRGFLPHLGIVSGPEHMIHAYETAGKVTETRLSLEWQRDIHSVWDFKEVV